MDVPAGVAIDPSARRIYWGNEAGNKISFANLVGGGGADLSTPGATLSGSRSPVLLKAPRSVRRPKIKRLSRRGSVLKCSKGSWAPDLLASWLYRAPQEFAYSWTRNRQRIRQARGKTCKASVEGKYR